MPMDESKKESKGFAFIEFVDKKAAANAVEQTGACHKDHTERGYLGKWNRLVPASRLLLCKAQGFAACCCSLVSTRGVAAEACPAGYDKMRNRRRRTGGEANSGRI